MSNYEKFENNISRFLHKKPKRRDDFCRRVAESFSKEAVEGEKVENLTSLVKKTTEIKQLHSLFRVLKTYRSNVEKTSDLRPAIALYYVSFVDQQHSEKRFPIERVLFQKSNTQNSFFNEFGWNPAEKSNEFKDKIITKEEEYVSDSGNKSIHRLDFIKIGSTEVNKFSSQFSQKDIDEIYEDYRFKTKGLPYSNSEGIIKSIVLNKSSDLRLPVSAIEIAQKTDETYEVQQKLLKLIEQHIKGVDTSNFSDVELITETFASNDEKLSDPGGEFFDLALKCHANGELLSQLKEHEAMSKPLSKAVFACVSNSIDGYNHQLSSLLYYHLSKIEYLSPKTRAISSLLQSKNDIIRGAIQEVNTSLDYGLEILSDEFHGRRTPLSDNVDLIASMYADKVKTLFCSTTLKNLDSQRTDKIFQAVKNTVTTIGIREIDLDDPDLMTHHIKNDSKFSHGLFVATYTYYYAYILKCIIDRVSPSEYFEKLLRINRKVAEKLPRPALLILTPIASLARISKETKYCTKCYMWRNGGHPEPSVNRMRNQIDQLNVMGTETAINLLMSHSNLKFLSEMGDRNAEIELGKISKLLISSERKFHRQDMKTIIRYYERFRAGIFNDKGSYLKSEYYPAPSHHLFFGQVEDQHILK